MTASAETQVGPRKSLCLPLEYLNGWLFGISERRSRPEIRDHPRPQWFQARFSGAARVGADVPLCPGLGRGRYGKSVVFQGGTEVPRYRSDFTQMRGQARAHMSKHAVPTVLRYFSLSHSEKRNRNRGLDGRCRVPLGVPLFSERYRRLNIGGLCRERRDE